MPVEYYEKAIDIILQIVPKRYSVKFSFQTNATLINEHWCRFFKKQEAELGISVDGPEFIHDRNRVTRSGKGTLQQVKKGIDLVREHGIPVNIISVLTEFSCRYPADLFEFYKSIGAQSVSFNVEEVEGENKVSSFSKSKTGKETVRQFMSAFFQLNLAEDEPFDIREFNWAKNSLLNGDLKADELYFTQMTGPFKTITINTQGDFSTFSPELITQKSTTYGDFILGNVMTDSFEESLMSKKFKRIFKDLVNGLKKCKRNCDYYGLCPGGIPSAKFSEQQTLNTDETQYCRLSLQTSIDAILEMVEKEKEMYAR
jgi:uncharacterized protein